MELRWRNILGPGTWPEILRRYAITRACANLLHVFGGTVNHCSVSRLQRCAPA